MDDHTYLAPVPAEAAQPAPATFPLDVPFDGTQPTRSGALRCPHCRFIGYRRSSRAITETHRDIYYQCPNVLCGHTWKATESYDFGIVPSAIPNPRVTLPLRPVSRQQALEAMTPPDPDQPGLFDGVRPAPPPEPPG